METLVLFLVATVPALLVAAIAYFLIERMLKAENARRGFELRKEAHKKLTPIRLQAHERMALLLERITPDSLLTRQNLSGITAVQLQTVLLQQIRQEWEHNLAQQLYIKEDTWIMLRNAKESMVQLVNTCATNVSLNSTALDFAKVILETYQSVEKTPVEVAMAMLKSDLNHI